MSGRAAGAVTAQHPATFAPYREAKVTTVVVGGIATNICCYFAARDFRQAGFRVLIVEYASAGIDVPEAGVWQVSAKGNGCNSVSSMCRRHKWKRRAVPRKRPG